MKRCVCVWCVCVGVCVCARGWVDGRARVLAMSICVSCGGGSANAASTAGPVVPQFAFHALSAALVLHPDPLRFVQAATEFLSHLDWLVQKPLTSQCPP